MQMCSRKEYCVFDIKQKLYNWELYESDAEEIIKVLIGEKFVDEERFVKAFVNDKFKFNHWGKVKIKYHLKHKHIEGIFVDNTLNEIDFDEYMKVIVHEISNKIKKVKANSTYERNAKVVNYMAGKGFEPDLVFKQLKKLK